MGQRDEVSEGHEEQGRTELADKDVAVMVQMRDDDAHLHHSAAKSQHVRIETPPPPPRALLDRHFGRVRRRRTRRAMSDCVRGSEDGSAQYTTALELEPSAPGRHGSRRLLRLRAARGRGRLAAGELPLRRELRRLRGLRQRLVLRVQLGRAARSASWQLQRWLRARARWMTEVKGRRGIAAVTATFPQLPSRCVRRRRRSNSCIDMPASRPCQTCDAPPPHLNAAPRSRCRPRPGPPTARGG